MPHPCSKNMKMRGCKLRLNLDRIVVICTLAVASFVPVISALAVIGAWEPGTSSGSSRIGAQRQTLPARSNPGPAMARITIDYPEAGSIFPPEITAPTFLWRDSEKAATLWRIDISFDGRAPEIHTTSKGEYMRVGRIDPNCISETNELPRLTPRQASSRTWTPDEAMWETIKRHSVSVSASVTITGFAGAEMNRPISRGRVTIFTSKDPVGAPIFYRDVPLMPTETEKGSIQPLAPYAVRLIQWRLRDIGERRGRLLMEDLPVCANCHSFSADGKTLGMDLDGLQNNKGMYTLTPVAPETSIRNENVIQWSSVRGRLRGKIRVGFMSQVSPDGQYVVTTTNPSEMEDVYHSGSPSADSLDPPSNYYVANFKDYRFLQVFYPTRGILSWYSRETGILQPLPGADDPRFVQMGAVWSPDGKYLVFARAEAKEPNPEGAPVAKFANDPNENQIRFDLYRIPFNQGKGGPAEPVEGASHNGMSNTFPKVSPDGRWIVFVQCRNGQLMRPDSRLYIVPASGGKARRMRCNTRLMNSWHSFSPNGRWLVFSSKSRSPYTQMYLTHIDCQGNDSPAILVENTTAANRAVNLPEFVNIARDGMRKIDGPVIEYYRLVDNAMYFKKKGRYEESIAEWRKVLGVNSDDALAHNNLGALLLLTGHPQEAAAHLRRAKEIRLEETEAQSRRTLELDPAYAPAYYNLGVVLAEQGKTDEAIRQWRKALEIDPDCVEVHEHLARTLYARGIVPEALSHWREAIRLQPENVPALQQAAWILATCPEASVRKGDEAVSLALRASQLSGGKDPMILDTLAAAYAEAGRFADAARTARVALARVEQENDTARAAQLKARIALYESGNPFRDAR